MDFLSGGGGGGRGEGGVVGFFTSSILERDPTKLEQMQERRAAFVKADPKAIHDPDRSDHALELSALPERNRN